MQDLPCTREWINETVSKYYEQLGITKVSKPIVLYGLEEAPKRVKSDPTAKKYKKFAAVSLFHPTNSRKPSYIVLNLPWHKSITELEDTIAHEILHMRFPKMECEGDDSHRFYKMLGMILCGQRFKRERKR